MVGVPGLEPGTSWSQTMRASQLRHTPQRLKKTPQNINDVSGGQYKTRTCDLHDVNVAL